MRDGIHPAAVFDDPLNNPSSGPKLVIPKPPPSESKPEPPKPQAPSNPANEPESRAGGGSGGGVATSSKPPAGMSLMDEIKWKQQQKAGGGSGGGNNSSPSSAPVSKPAPPKPAESQAAPAAPKAASSLAARQAMLAGVLGGGGGGSGSGAAPKKDAPPPAKKWAKVETDGSGSVAANPNLASAANALASKLGNSGSAVTNTSSSGPPPDLTKYEKMAKMLPQGAVENAMVRDGIDPGWLFEECITVKTNIKPVKKDAAPPAPAAAPASTAATSVPVQQVSPPKPASVPQPQNVVAQPTLQPSHPSFLAPQPTHMQPQPTHIQPQQPPVFHQPQQPTYYQQPQYQQPQYAPQYAAPPQPVTLSAWIQVWSPEHNAIYYTNTQTGESSWYPPPGYQPNQNSQPVIPQQKRQIVTMMYNFTPTGANPNEMAVFANDQIEVYNVGYDGWLTGRCLRSGVLGLVPLSKFLSFYFCKIDSNVPHIDYTRQ